MPEQSPASMLRELNDQPAAPEPEPAAAEWAYDVDEDSGLPPLGDRDLADTAALLRELSSLGFNDEDSGGKPPPPPPVTRPVQSGAPDKKKRKGLFGRG
jgi:hypothetical protein